MQKFGVSDSSRITGRIPRLGGIDPIFQNLFRDELRIAIIGERKYAYQVAVRSDF